MFTCIVTSIWKYAKKKFCGCDENYLGTETYITLYNTANEYILIQKNSAF